MYLQRTKPEEANDIASIHKLTIGSSWTSEDIAEALTSLEKVVFSIYEKQQIIGYLMLRVLPPEAEIFNIAIIPSKQNQSYGSKSLELLFPELRRQGIEDVYLEVRAESKAVDFYKKNGFIVLGVRKSYYPDGEDALLMKIKLG